MSYIQSSAASTSTSDPTAHAKTMHNAKETHNRQNAEIRGIMV